MKKGEIQIQETILVIFIITLIISLGIFIFYNYNLNVVENERLEYEQVKIYNLLSIIPNMPEFQYSYLGNPENAIDTSKLLNLNLNMGNKEITIKQIYPKQNQEILCTNNNYPSCNFYNIYSKKLLSKNINILRVPVSLYYPLTKEYRAGLLEIKWYY